MREKKKKVLVFGSIPTVTEKSLSKKFIFVFVNALETINYYHDEVWLIVDKVSQRTKRDLKNSNIKFDKTFRYEDLI